LLAIAGCQKPEVAKPTVEIPAAASGVEPASHLAEDAPEVPFPELPLGAGKIDDDAPRKFTTTESGLKYRVLRPGAGPTPTAQQTVEVHYHGWLDNKKVFDSSYDRFQTISFPLDGVIRGWTEGMQKINKGGMIELEIPPRLGYGGRGSGNSVPPNATLHFLVELKDIK
jgi:FKBP-type peptidyl-prolyl cis-trans isomerase